MTSIRSSDHRSRRLGSYASEQVAIELLEARALLAFVDDKATDAVAIMREVVGREDATVKSAVTPGSMLPAHELLSDLLRDMGAPRGA